ncbi:response regulator transcription factor [Azospirillum sp.]|uniref:response regulator transcription factor n=1 Tax=Azospirillum sp. TaxID=34012 RepID=UPI003D74BBEA
MTDPSTPTVFVVDDDEAVRKSLAWLIGSVGLAVQAYESADAFLASWTVERPGCLVLDVRMPGMSGLELQDALARRGSSLPVIIVTGHADVPMAVRALKAGAVDFIEKPFNDQVLLDRIQDAVKRSQSAFAGQARRALVQALLARLTPRERQVAELVAAGKPNKVIAFELDLSMKTVEVHRHNVMDKLEVASVADLTRLFVEANAASGAG